MADTATSRGADGNVMTQLAVCRRAAGVALLSDLTCCELRGSGPGLDALALALVGGSPGVGDHVAAPWGWWIRTSAHRALAMAEAPGDAALRCALTRAHEAARDIAAADRSADYAALVLAGPRAGRVGAAGAAVLPEPVVVVTDGEDYQVLLVPAVGALAALPILLAAGRGDGAVAVGLRAVATLRAAHRVLTGQRPAPQLRLPTEHSKPGAPTT